MRLLSDVPVGAFLSGGIDSSLVVALMQEVSPSTVKTYTLGFRNEAYDEAPHAARVARHLGSDHHEMRVDDHDVLELVPRLAGIFDEPFADISQIPTLLISQLARTQVTVALSGDAGDELFAGYGRYFAILDLWSKLRHVPPRLTETPVRTLRSVATGLRHLPLRWRGEVPLPERMLRLAQRIASPDLDRLRLSFLSGVGAQRIRTASALPDIRHGLPPEELAAPLRRLMYADQSDWLPDDILTKVDRASMHHSLEVRTPLLDHRLIEFSWTLSSRLLHRGRTGKQLLREVLYRRVPRELIERPKKGFTPPLGDWLRGALRDWAQTQISDPDLQHLPLLDAPGVRALWKEHLSGRTDASGSLWRALMLLAWRREYGAA
jgi:asparagine synthase (glutamine-hydrolysing)